MATDIERLIQEIRALPPEDQDRLRHALAEQVPPQEPAGPATPEELAEVEYQERLVNAGLLEQVRPRRRDQRAFDRFQPIQITGKPLSETIIEERR